jgi:DNA-binding IclR family transcriptional regulator
MSGAEAPLTAATVPAVAQAFTIIDALAHSTQPLRLTEVIEETGLPKTTAYRLLKTLTDLGVVCREDRDFRLGSRLVRYGNAAVPNHTDLIGLFYALIGPLHQELDETVQLAVLTPPDITFLAFVDTSQPVRLATRIGRRLPAHASAAGKAILAFSPNEVVEQVLTSGMRPVTSRTITDPALLLRHLDQVRARGWAFEAQESTNNLSCVAVPVLNRTGTATAAITVCLPLPVLAVQRQRTLAAALSRFAGDLSHRLNN